jgi:hypothetical protein
MSIELKEFRKNLTYQTNAPIQNIVTELNEIAEIDKIAEIKQKKDAKKALYYFFSLLAAIVSLIVAPNIIKDERVSGFTVYVLFITIFSLIGVLSFTLIKRNQHSKLNLSNYRYELTQQIMQMLARDIEPTNNIAVLLSFNGINGKFAKKVTNQHPTKSGWKIDNYKHEWLNIQGKLLDKTRFDLTATEMSKTQSGSKRSRSGKSKYKSKTKSIGLDISLTLTFSERRYRGVNVLKNQVMGAVKVPNNCEIRNLKVTDKSIFIVGRISPSSSNDRKKIYQTITMMFLSLYQILNLAKSISK